jgi:DNA-binding transcriptional regulator YbjK
MATNPRRHRASAQARREALLRAAMEVAAERGMAGVSHRAVTEKAGLPLATISYFFDSITELAQEALRVFMEADTTQQLALAESLRERHSAPADILAAFAETAAPRKPETPALFEVLLHASRSPELRGAVTEAIEAGRHVAEAAARAGGASNPDSAAILALAHGYALHRLAAPDTVAADALQRGLRALLLGGLLDQGHIELAVRLAESTATQPTRSPKQSGPGLLDTASDSDTTAATPHSVESPPPST